MTKAPYQQLANQFIDMWQQQMQSLVTDKDFVQTMLGSLQQFSNFATAGNHEPGATQGSSNTTAASADVAQLLGQLDYRLRMVEARLLQLESAGRRPNHDEPNARPRGKSGSHAVRKPAKRR